jgi:mRNA interferase MazF
MMQKHPSRMQKDFDRWNKLKKTTDGKDEAARLFFREGEIWWVHLGVNIGYETDGKRKDFARPVVVLKKYNQYSFLALPLSTANKSNRYWAWIGNVDGKDAFANLSQLRNIDSKRLINKVAHLPADHLEALKKEASRVNFG